MVQFLSKDRQLVAVYS